MIKPGNNYKGYYLKIGNVEFNDPHPKRDSYKYAPALEQVGDSYVLASGYLNVKLIGMHYIVMQQVKVCAYYVKYTMIELIVMLRIISTIPI